MRAKHEDSDGTGYCRECGSTIGEDHHADCPLLNTMNNKKHQTKETLREKQSRFAYMVSRLIMHIYAEGYECTLGDAYRDPRSHAPMGVRGPYGRSTSAHKHRLAIDLNLFRDGRFLESTGAHRAFGEWWELQGGTWGGRWADGNHYSLEHEGIK